MNATEDLRDLAQRGVGFDMNPTMMFTTAESMYSQWHDYFTRLDQAWRERVAAAADALSSPPADDVREALAFTLFRHEYVYASDAWAEATWPRSEQLRQVYQEKADAILAAFEVRPYGMVTEAEVEVPPLANDCDCEDREALVRPEGLVCGTCGKVIEAAREVRPYGTVTGTAEVESRLRESLANYLDLRTVARVMADLEAAREARS